MKTRSFNSTLSENVGPEKFNDYLEKSYLKTNGEPLKSHKNYGLYLTKALKSLNLDSESFSKIRSVFHLNILRKLLEDKYGFRKLEKEVQNLFCVYDHYIAFVKWRNDLDSTCGSLISIAPKSPSSVPTAYAQAA